MTKAGDGQNRTENKNAAVAKGINANMRCFCRLAWFTREFYYTLLQYSSFLFCTAKQCTCQTLQKHLMSLVKSSYWYSWPLWFCFVLDFCLILPLDDDIYEQKHSAELSHTFSFLFQNMLWFISAFPTGSTYVSFLWKSKSLDEDPSSENMWWRLVSSFSQIKRFMFNVTTVPCNSHVSLIVLRVLGCMWVWFFFITSDKHLISRSNEVALMKTEMLGWLCFFLCGGKIAKSFQNMRQFFCEKQKDVK